MGLAPPLSPRKGRAQDDREMGDGTRGEGRPVPTPQPNSLKKHVWIKGEKDFNIFALGNILGLHI